MFLQCQRGGGAALAGRKDSGWLESRAEEEAVRLISGPSKGITPEIAAGRKDLEEPVYVQERPLVQMLRAFEAWRESRDGESMAGTSSIVET